MLQIPCPHCGLRSEHEFMAAGEFQPRPEQPAALDDAAWADFLYQRDNPDGPVLEHWWHLHGCRSWLVLRRDPHTQAIVEARMAGQGA
jgi:heterotetrameric sarcosine oxidase delta subunit